MMLFTLPKLRGKDVHGSGAYGAPRKGRKHKGLDYAVSPGKVVFSAIEGIVRRLGYPYSNNLELRLIEIETEASDLVRYLYVLPIVKKGDHVAVGDALGEVQRLPYKGITQHVHVDVKMMVNKRRKYVDPEWYFEEFWL